MGYDNQIVGTILITCCILALFFASNRWNPRQLDTFCYPIPHVKFQLSEVKF